MTDRRNAALLRAQLAEDDMLDARAETLGTLLEISDLRQRLESSYAAILGFKAELNAALRKIGEEAAAADLANKARDEALLRVSTAESNHARLAEAILGLSNSMPKIESMQIEHSALLVELSQVRQELVALGQVKLKNAEILEEYDDLFDQAQLAEDQIEVLKLTRAMQEARVQELQLVNRRVAELEAAKTNAEAQLQALAAWAARKRIIFGLLRRPAVGRLNVIRERANQLGVNDEISDHSVHWIARRRCLFGLLRRPTRYAELLILHVLAKETYEIRDQIKRLVDDSA